MCLDKAFNESSTYAKANKPQLETINIAIRSLMD